MGITVLLERENTGAIKKKKTKEDYQSVVYEHYPSFLIGGLRDPTGTRTEDVTSKLCVPRS